MILKISGRNQIREVWHIIDCLIYVMIFMIIIMEKPGEVFYWKVLFFTFIPWSFLSIPGICLYIEYYFANKDEEITLSSDGILIKVKGIEKKEYKYSEIKEIRHYQTGGTDPKLKRIPFWAHQYYHFVKIIIQDGEECIITSLMTKNLFEVINEFRIKGIRIDMKIVGLPLIFLEGVQLPIALRYLYTDVMNLAMILYFDFIIIIGATVFKFLGGKFVKENGYEERVNIILALIFIVLNVVLPLLCKLIVYFVNEYRKDQKEKNF